MDEKTIKAEQFPEPAKSILLRGERVELIPVKNSVKVVRVRREEVKDGKKMQRKKLPDAAQYSKSERV